MVVEDRTVEREGHHTYRAAGLTIAAQCRLPGLSDAVAASPDLRVMQGRPQWAESCRQIHYISDNMIDGAPSVIVERSEHGYAFRYADGTAFWLDGAGSLVWMSVATTFEDACTYLLGPVLSFALRLRGDFSLHASAVESRAGAVALIGPHGAGKSTLAAALGRRGVPVLTDDILRLTRVNGEWTAHAFGGVIRLWEEAESLVFGAPGVLPPLTPTWPKRGLQIGSHGVAPAADSRLLAGLVFLKAVEGSSPPRLRATSAPETILRLIGNSSASLLLNAHQRAVEFHHVSSMTHLPSVEIERGDSRDSLAQLLATVEDWIDSLPARRE